MKKEIITKSYNILKENIPYFNNRFVATFMNSKINPGMSNGKREYKIGETIVKKPNPKKIKITGTEKSINCSKSKIEELTKSTLIEV